jgi:prepilin-type N-terminal cleavage/methylation domain-containing protein
MIQHLSKKRNEEGFTLIELLVVIVILGILAAVVVFAVGGITDKGQTSACKADKKTIQTAEEANFAKNGSYTDEAGLVTNKFLSEASTLYNVSTSPAPYTITVDAANSSPCT